VRYRISSEDRNRFSYWTNIFRVDPQFFYESGTLESRGILTLEKVGSSYVGITWDSVSIYKQVNGNSNLLGELDTYDLWIKWAQNGGTNPSNWIYRERVSTTSVNINIPSSYIDATGVSRSSPKELYVEIHRPARQIIRYQQTAPFIQNSTTVNITDDYIFWPNGHGSNTGTAGLYLSATPISGLSNNTTYYTRTIDYKNISLHPTLQNAIDNVNKINLTGTPSGTGSFTGFPFRMYASAITTL
jgi:hypothetical protein